MIKIQTTAILLILPSTSSLCAIIPFRSDEGEPYLHVRAVREKLTCLGSANPYKLTSLPLRLNNRKIVLKSNIQE
jgi:hypothetical protein